MVVDPNNGNILAMASVPSFDPNTFIPSIKAKDWKALRKDEAHPLINRAVSAFPAGFDFQARDGSLPVCARVWRTRRFNCSGGVTYGDHYFQCWISEKGGSHGTLGLSDAIKVSCNSFFYQFGNAAGIDAIDDDGRDARPRQTNRGSKSRANPPAFCLGRIGCGSIIRTKTGRRPTPPTFPSARATILLRRCRWRWPMPPSRMAAVSYYPRLGRSRV